VDVITVFGFFLPRLAPSLRGWALLAGGVLAAIALAQGLRPPVVQNYEVRLAGLSGEMDGKVLVAMSDLHLGSLIGKQWLAARVAQVKEERPDLVVLLGDLFEGHGQPQEELLPILRRLSAPLGIWAVTGNHEFHGADNKGMGLAGVVSFSPLLYLGLRYSTAVNCSLIQGFSPLITALIAGLIIREPVTRRQLAGAVLGLVGVAGLLSSGSLTFMLQLQFNPGDLILLASAVVWAFYAVFGRRVMRNRSPVAATALSNFISLPLIAAAAAFELQYIPLNLRVETIAAIAHICVVPTIIGYWSWNRGLTTLGAGGAMVFYNTLPLYGAALGAVLLGEPLGMIHFVFGGLILIGGLWATLGKERHSSSTN
jgi:drug/metabolite transporter (DMT)-like permease